MDKENFGMKMEKYTLWNALMASEIKEKSTYCKMIKPTHSTVLSMMMKIIMRKREY